MAFFGGWFCGVVIVVGYLVLDRYLKSKGKSWNWKIITLALLVYVIAILDVNVPYLCFWELQEEAGTKMLIFFTLCLALCGFGLYRALFQTKKAA